VANPVQTIALTSRRIAKLAALRTFLFALIPAATALIIAFSLDTIGANTWELLGYVLTADRELALQVALVLGAGSMVAASAVQAILVYRREHDFMKAAAEIDERIRGHEEIITLAALSNPAHIQESRAQRSPLFPLLWRRAIAYFEGFDPRFEFRLDWRRPLTKSTLFAAAGALLMLIATLGLVRAPTPQMAEAQKLRKIAREIEKTSSSPAQLALAASVREAAKALENPTLPPEKKMEKLEQVMRDIQKQQQQQQQGQQSQGHGLGNSEGSTQKSAGSGNNADKNAAGASKGQGEGKGQGQGAGKSEGAGTDKNAKGGSGKEKTGQGSGSGDKEQKAQSQSVKLQNELKNAEAQVQAEGAKNPNPENNQAGSGKNKGAGESAGNKPDQKGAGNKPNPNMAGNISMPGAKGGNKPSGNEANGPERQGGSNQGDTHLGEMPAPVKYQRFLKPGEKGEALDIHDARYVMFRLPSEVSSGSGGKTVLDSARPRATTPYANVPLAPTRDDAPPDERQLVPPRYRDLIR
jgi:hypothetical protein